MTAIGLASAADSGRNGLARVRAIARWWDEAFRVPVLGWRVGLDAVVGLVPGLGDLIGLVVSGLLIVEAVRLGTGRAVVARMVLNVGIDALIGTIPLVGDLFDLGWKANRRNRDLLERWLAAPTAAERSSGAVVAAAIVAVGGAVVAVSWLVVVAVGAIAGR